MGEILDRVVEDGSVDVLSLAQEFGVSAATVRRDLQALHHQGLLRRGRRVRWLRWHGAGLRAHGAHCPGRI